MFFHMPSFNMILHTKNKEPSFLYILTPKIPDASYIYTTYPKYLRYQASTAAGFTLPNPSLP